MATLYFVENIGLEGENVAFETQNDAKDAARNAYTDDKVERHVLKVELNKELGTRALMCALFNGETDKFMGSKEVIFTAGPRKRRGSSEAGEPAAEVEADPENPYDI